MRTSAALRATPILLVLALAACGTGPSPDPIPTLTLASASTTAPVDADALIERVVRAVADADETHLAGTYREPAPQGSERGGAGDGEDGRRTLRVDVQGRPDRFSAVLDVGDVHAELVRDGETVTVRGNEALSDALGQTVPAGGLTLAADDPRLADWLPLTDVPALVASILDTRRPGIDFGVLDGGLVLTISAGGRQTGTVTLEPDTNRPLAISVSDGTGSADLTLTW